MRGVVYIAPVERVPGDGSMIDPATGVFWASWQDEDEVAALEDVQVVGADAAIAWGRERAEVVMIRLGNRGDTYFSAGIAQLEGDDDPAPDWPPSRPPVEGWWQPLTSPTLGEIDHVLAEVASGACSAEDASRWASDRLHAATSGDAPDAVMQGLIRLLALGGNGISGFG